jgi:CheY-like chemotaxis protein
MLVDDHTSMRQTMTMFFERHEAFSVVAQAANGLEAVQMAKEFRYTFTLRTRSIFINRCYIYWMFNSEADKKGQFLKTKLFVPIDVGCIFSAIKQILVQY